MTAPSDRRRATHEQWLLEITSIPTAAGREQRVVRWIQSWAKKRAKRLSFERDRHGNVVLRSRGKAGKGQAPLYITA
ncbi:MAG: hypothetical protein KDA22_13225, partial [Phycisphaerales bacterium]|nr:hypothetical protein [Phycisphaerales bacterium]